MKVASLVQHCFPDPPTPINITLTLLLMSMRPMRVTWLSAYSNRTRSIALFLGLEFYSFIFSYDFFFKCS